ncbi:hypothetical protein HHK36_013219 [Tetracentron sinense]|uniref:Uncharacterized protein n=1 Tax=Tetracentron sinense TaxID=13715 RepID=A0A834Z9G3_TETSI|nr:hypothetical protein HHK36_013219 [Tetracentron sinense]
MTHAFVRILGNFIFEEALEGPPAMWCRRGWRLGTKVMWLFWDTSDEHQIIGSERNQASELFLMEPPGPLDLRMSPFSDREWSIVWLLPWISVIQNPLFIPEVLTSSKWWTVDYLLSEILSSYDEKAMELEPDFYSGDRATDNSVYSVGLDHIIWKSSTVQAPAVQEIQVNEMPSDLLASLPSEPCPPLRILDPANSRNASLEADISLSIRIHLLKPGWGLSPVSMGKGFYSTRCGIIEKIPLSISNREICSQAGPVFCGKPTLRSTVPSLCTIHFQMAQKHVTRALKKAGLNITSSNKLAPKFHVLVAESVRQIQTKRRAARRVTVDSIVVKEENVS